MTMPRFVPIKPPRSEILVQVCTSEWARDRVKRGYYPRGSIWFPGSPNRRPDLGTLFAPDPDWQPPRLPAADDIDRS